MDVFHGDWRAPKASRPIITVVATDETTSRHPDRKTGPVQELRVVHRLPIRSA
jgi:hypothetical protein